MLAWSSFYQSLSGVFTGSCCGLTLHSCTWQMSPFLSEWKTPGSSQLSSHLIILICFEQEQDHALSKCIAPEFQPEFISWNDYQACLLIPVEDNYKQLTLNLKNFLVKWRTIILHQEEHILDPNKWYFVDVLHSSNGVGSQSWDCLLLWKKIKSQSSSNHCTSWSFILTTMWTLQLDTVQ